MKTDQEIFDWLRSLADKNREIIDRNRARREAEDRAQLKEELKKQIFEELIEYCEKTYVVQALVREARGEDMLTGDTISAYSPVEE